MGIGTFGTFTQARLGIYTATKGLTVTGNNISNINTVGYTRQAVDQVSLRNGGADRYQGEVRIGNGALIRSVSQLRDPYLDIRYRAESSIVGYTNTKLENLTSIADIIDEVGKGNNKGDGILFAQFSDFLSSLQELNTDAAAQSNDTLARASADTLTNLFHFYAEKLENLEKGTADRLKQEIDGLNGVLNGIRDLNAAIRKSEIHGDPGLEMRDERNRLIDQLAEYVKIDVIYTMEDAGAGQQVEKLTIKLGNANPDPESKTDSTVLVDGIYARTFDMPDTLLKVNDKYDPNHKPADPDNLDPVKDLPLFKYLKADGTGTNKPAEAEKLANSNYDLTLSRLVDSKGRQWSNILGSSTVKEDPAPADAPLKAVYSYTLGGNLDWADNTKEKLSSILIDNKEYYIGVPGNVIDPADPTKKITADTPYITPAVAKDINRLASFIAGELGKSDTYKDYDVTSVGAKIVFTAKNAGAVGQLKDKDGNPLVTKGGAISKDAFDKENPPPAVLAAPDDKGVEQKISLKLAADGNYDPTNGTESYFTVEGAALVNYNPANKPDNVLTDAAGNPVVLNAQGKPFATKTDLDAAFAAGEKCSYITVQKGGDPINGSGPEKEPGLTLDKGGTTLTLTPDAAPVQEGREAGPDWNPSSIKTNPDGSKTLTSYAMRGTDWYKTEIVSEYSQEIKLDDNDLYGAIQAFRETLTEAGEFSTADTVKNVDENATIKRGIPYYQKSLDLLARVFANAFNEANNGYAVDQNGSYLDAQGKVLTLGGEAVVKGAKLTDAQQEALDSRAMTDFLKQNGFAGIDKDGFAVDADSKQLTLGGEPVQIATPPVAADPANPTADEAKALAAWKAFQTGVKGVNADGKFIDNAGNGIKYEYTGAAGDPATVETVKDVVLSKEQQTALNEQALDTFLSIEGDKIGGNLFSNRGDLNDGEGITAANISVSHSWSNGDVHIVNTFTKLFGGDIQNTTQDNNISHMISLMGQALVYDPSSLVPEADSTHLFQGSFHEMLVSMCSVLGNDKREIETQLNTAATYQVEMDTSRDAVSAVDLNDEAMNLMQYAKSLNAAYRLMTTLDEALDRLINNTGIVGR